MKREELKAFGIRGEENGVMHFATVYPKAKVDKLLDEKDAEIRRLRRALYKACANWAKARDTTDPIGFDKECLSGYKWYRMMLKCRAMAEKWR